MLSNHHLCREANVMKSPRDSDPCRWGRMALSLVAVWSLLVTAAWAQNPQAGAPAAESASMATFRQAFQKTRTANTVDELSQIIRLCQQGLEGGGSEAELKYGRDLLAWSYNKRG